METNLSSYKNSEQGRPIKHNFKKRPMTSMQAPKSD